MPKSKTKEPSEGSIDLPIPFGLSTFGRLNEERIDMKRHLIFLLAGLIFGSVTGIASVSFAAEGKWTESVAMQTARGGLATAVVDSRIYAFGGNTGIHFGNPGTVYPTVEEYAPEGIESTTTAVSPQEKKRLTWAEIKRR